MAIRFLRPWQGRQIGQIDRVLSPGVVATLIEYGYAERVVEEQRKHKERKRQRKQVEDVDDSKARV